MIGNDIRIQVLSNKKGQVRIGIDAPRNISVKREELFNKEQPEILDDSSSSETTGSA